MANQVHIGRILALIGLPLRRWRVSPQWLRNQGPQLSATQRPRLRVGPRTQHRWQSSDSSPSAPLASDNSVEDSRRPKSAVRSAWLGYAGVAGGVLVVFYLGRWSIDDSGPGLGSDAGIPLQQGTGNPLSSTLPLSEVPALTHDTSPGNISAARREIASIVGADAVVDRRDELDRHTSSDWSSHPLREADSPRFVVYPTSTLEVSEVVKVCHRRRVPVVAFSGGTSLEGHFANVCGGITLDLSRMDRVLALHREDANVVVEPGMAHDALNRRLEAEGLFFPPDPGPGAMVGGMVATACSGPNAFRWGPMRDWVVGLTVVLADGSVVRTRRRPRKSSAGYDLTRLFVGSEGTLGIVTEAVLRVAPRPRNERVAVASFDSYKDACDAVICIVAEGVSLAAVELLGGSTMALVNDNASVGGRVWRETPTLFLRFAGSTEGAVNEQIDVVGSILSSSRARGGMELAKDKAEAEELWSARKLALFAALSKRKEGEGIYMTDVAVPISRLAEIVEVSGKEIEAAGFEGGIVGHVGDGNFHSLMFYPPERKHIAEKIGRDMVDRAITMEGTVSGEHGIGLQKRDHLEKELGTTTVDLMRQLKKAFDPLCLLNCDKVVRMKPPQEK